MRWVRLGLLVVVGALLLSGAWWFYDQVIVRDQDPFTGRPRQAAPRRTIRLPAVTPPRLPEAPEVPVSFDHGPPDVELGEVPDVAEFGRPRVVLTCSVADLTTQSTGLYVSHPVAKRGGTLAPGAQPTLVQGGELRVPALPNQGQADVFFDDVGLVRMTWDATAAGDVTCADTTVIAPPVPVLGAVRDADGAPMSGVSVVGCGGIARTDASGAFSMRVAGGTSCTLHAVRFEGETATWGPSATWTPHPTHPLVLEWAPEP